MESIVAQKMATEDKTYRILEIMPDGAESEMGYLAAGSEPVALAADGNAGLLCREWYRKYAAGENELYQQLKAAFGGREDSFR